MSSDKSGFDPLRPRLMGIAYRMLGSVAESEEVVQDAWLRWHESAQEDIDNSEAWLVTVTTRLAIDRLRAAKVQREHYVGTWLPEPQLSDGPTPEQMAERADDISVAFLAVLERLTPEARAAFLLREVFDADYDEVARTIGKSEAACRQLVHRARMQLQDQRPRHVVPRDVHHRLLGDFAEALRTGNIETMKSLLTDDAVLIGDGGGIVTSFPKPLVGSWRIAKLMFAGFRRYGDAQRVELAPINGQWGWLRYVNGALQSADSFETDGQRIVRIHVQRNPEKLARLASALSAQGS